MITNHNSQNIHTSDVQNYKYIIYTDTYVQEVYDIWYWTSFSNHAIRMSQDPCLFHVIFSVAQIHNAPAPVSFGYAPPPPFSAIHSSLEKFHMKFPSTELSGNCHEERMMKIMDEISQDRELWYYILIYIYILWYVMFLPYLHLFIIQSLPTLAEFWAVAPPHWSVALASPQEDQSTG